MAKGEEEVELHTYKCRYCDIEFISSDREEAFLQYRVHLFLKHGKRA